MRPSVLSIFSSAGVEPSVTLVSPSQSLSSSSWSSSVGVGCVATNKQQNTGHTVAYNSSLLDSVVERRHTTPHVSLQLVKWNAKMQKPVSLTGLAAVLFLVGKKAWARRGSLFTIWNQSTGKRCAVGWTATRCGSVCLNCAR